MMSLPFRIDETGGIATTSDISEQLVHRVFSVLSTEFGERVMRPTYGWDFTQFLWEPIDALDERHMLQLANSALTKWEPGASLVGLRMERTDDAEVTISFYFQAAGGSPFTGQLSFGTADDGGVFTQVLVNDLANTSTDLATTGTTAPNTTGS